MSVFIDNISLTYGNMVIVNDYMYICTDNLPISSISKISMTDPIHDRNNSWNISYSYNSIAYSNGYLYAAGSGPGAIRKLSITDPNDNNYSWGNNPGFVSNLYADDNYLYIAYLNNNDFRRTAKLRIQRINLTNRVSEPFFSIDDLLTPSATITTTYGIITYYGYLYISLSNSSYKTIGKISLSNPTNDFDLQWVNGFPALSDSPLGLTIGNGYLYVICYNRFTSNNYKISKISISNPTTDYDRFWLSINQAADYLSYYENNIYVLQRRRVIKTQADTLIGLYNPKGLVINNGYFYVANSNNTISKIKTSNLVVLDVYTYYTSYISLVMFNGYLYAANNNSIIKIDLSNPAIFVSPWPSQGVINALSLNGSGWVATDGNYLYITNNNSISRISLTVPNLDYTANWVSVNNTTGMTVYNGYLYACTSDNKIYRISLTNKTIFTWATISQGLNNPQGIVNDGTYLYVANYNTNRICQISITNPNSNYNISWATNSQGLNGPVGLTTYNGHLYATNYINNTITQLSLPTPPVPPPTPTPPTPTPPYLVDNAMESCLNTQTIESCNTSCKPSYKKLVTSGNDPSISKAMLISLRIKTAKRNNCNVVNYIKNDSSCY